MRVMSWGPPVVSRTPSAPAPTRVTVVIPLEGPRPVGFQPGVILPPPAGAPVSSEEIRLFQGDVNTLYQSMAKTKGR